MKKILIVALSLFILTTCTQSDEGKEAPEASFETLNSLLTTPRDSLSLEQKETLLEIALIMDEKIEFEDGYFVNKATEEDFKAKGIDLYYFEMVNKGVSEINTVIKNDDLDNAEELFRDSKKQLKTDIENLSH